MEMELILAPEDGTRLPRLQALAADRATRARPRVARIRWHDGPDRELSAQGLILTECGNAWRLERLCPDDAAWPPAAPPPCLDQGDSRTALVHPLPQTLVPAVMFEGHVTRSTPTMDGEAVAMTLWSGTLRAGAIERQVCRLTLDGPAPAVRSLALILAGALRVSVPTASLAAEAIGLELARAPPPRRLGAPTLNPALAVDAAFRHVMGHVADVILHHAGAILSGVEEPEPVHQMRVATRRARSALSVFRGTLAGPNLEAANQGLKALGGRLGPTRNWDVFLTETAPTVAAAFPGDQRLSRLVAAGARQRKDNLTMLRAYLGGPEFRQLGVTLAWLAGAEEGCDVTVAPGTALADFAAKALRQRWKKLTSPGKSIEALDLPALHALRLQAKPARYTAEMFQPLFPGKHAGRFVRRLSRLQQALGLLNDADTARLLLQELGGPGGRHGYAAGLILGFSAERARSVREDIHAVWRKLRRQSPFWA